MSNDVKMDTSTAIGCCILGLGALAVEIWALVWAIGDITSTPQVHRTADIVVFVVVGLLLLGNAGARARQ